MRKIFILLAIVLALSSVLVGCSPKIDVNEPITHTGNGIEITLPRYMRKETVEDYDMYFSNLAIILTAEEVDREMLDSLELTENVTRAAFVDRILEINSLDKSKLENYVESDELQQTAFSYIVREESDDGVDLGTGTFVYVIIVGEASNLHYVSILCEVNYGGDNIKMFNDWRKNIKAVPKTEAR